MSTNDQSTERAQHTPEPWYFGRTAADKRLILGGSRRRYVATVQIYQIPRQMGIHDELEREGNGRRIVAAVNACAVIPTEALEGGVVRDLLEIIARALPVIENIPLDFYRCDECASWMQDARAAVAKAGARHD